MVEGVEEFSAELQRVTLRELELFEQAQVGIFNTGSMEGSRAAGSEGSDGRIGECRSGQEEPGGLIRAGVVVRRTGSTRERIANAVGICRVVRAGETVVGSGHGERTAGLQAYDSVDLPSPQNGVAHSAAVHIPPPRAERKIHGKVADEAVADVQDGVAHLRRVVVSVLRQWTGRQVVAKICQSMAPGVVQRVGVALRHSPAQ